MPWFEYEGLTPGATAIAGRIEAADTDQAKQELARMGIELRDMNLVREPSRKGVRLSESDLVFFNEQLASLADAGIALDEGLAQLARDISSPRLKQWVEGLVEDLRRGVPLDQAIAARESGLPLLYSRVIRAGIDSGELSATLLNLNHHLQLTGNTRKILWELISYPLLIMVFATGIGSFFYGFVVPRFKEIFADWGTLLPLPTRWAISIGDHYWTIMLVGGCLLAAALLVWQMLRLSPGGRAVRESIVFHTPLIGRVYRASLVARFLRGVATSVATGIPLPQALRLGSGATGSTLLINDAERLAAGVERGESIFAAGRSARIIPPLFGYCVQVAIGREALPMAIGQLAHSYENRAVHTQSLLRVVLFPLFILIVGGLLAFGIIAMFMPLVTLVNCIA